MKKQASNLFVEIDSAETAQIADAVLEDRVVIYNEATGEYVCQKKDETDGIWYFLCTIDEIENNPQYTLSLFDEHDNERKGEAYREAYKNTYIMFHRPAIEVYEEEMELRE